MRFGLLQHGRRLADDRLTNIYLYRVSDHTHHNRLCLDTKAAGPLCIILRCLFLRSGTRRCALLT